MKPMKTALIWLTILTTTVLAGLMSSTPALAASGGWSTPVLLDTVNAPSLIRDPDIVADRTGGVHVVWVSDPVDTAEGTRSLITYTRSLGTRWSKPVDIQAVPSAHSPSIAVTTFGVTQLVWTSREFTLYRSQARADQDSTARSWTAPIPVATAAYSASVVTGGDGRLYLAYAGQGGSGVFLSRSTDGGQTWSFPSTASGFWGPNTGADYVRLAIGDDGTIHLVWSEFQLPKAWPPTGVYYTHSTDGGKTWAPVIQLAGLGFDQVNVAAGPKHSVYVAWNARAGIQGRYARYSGDNGKTWSAAALLQAPAARGGDTGGSTGPPGIVVDGAGVAHVLFVWGNRVYYAEGRGNLWSTPEYIPSGNETGIPADGVAVDARIRHTEQAVMALSGGNEVNVVFYDERATLGRVYVWYTNKRVDAPSIAPQPFLTLSPTLHIPPTATASTAIRTAQVARVTPLISAGNKPNSPAIGPTLPVMISIFPVFALTVGTILLQTFRLRHR